MLISEYEYVIVGRIGPKWGWAFSSSHNGPAICSPIFQPRELSIIHPKLRRERQRRSLAGASPALPLPFQRLVVSTRWPRAPLAASSSFPSCPRNSRCLILHSGGGAGAGPALVLPAAAPRPAVGGEALSRTTLLNFCRSNSVPCSPLLSRRVKSFKFVFFLSEKGRDAIKKCQFCLSSASDIRQSMKLAVGF